MEKYFHKGDRVRLDQRIKPGQNSNGRIIDWRVRTGTVAHIGEYTGNISVLWDGRKSIDNWPSKALVVVGSSLKYS